MKPTAAGRHRHLCTIELVAEGHAERCPGEPCPFWERECALTRIEHELDSRPDIAGALLTLRRELEAGREIELAAAQLRLSEALEDLEQEQERERELAVERAGLAAGEAPPPPSVPEVPTVREDHRGA